MRAGRDAAEADGEHAEREAVLESGAEAGAGAAEGGGGQVGRAARAAQGAAGPVPGPARRLRAAAVPAAAGSQSAAHRRHGHKHLR